MFDSIQTDYFSWHQIMWEFLSLDSGFDDLGLMLFEFSRVEEFDEIVDFTLYSGEWVLGLVIVQESKLDLLICHWWGEFAFGIEYCQVYNYHNQ